jgi:hypothetical protein
MASRRGTWPTARRSRSAAPITPRACSACCARCPRRRQRARHARCAPRPPTPREAELAYLRRLQLGELVHTELYTPMAGVARVLTPAAPAASLPAVVMRPEFRHLRRRSAATAEARSESRAYEDIAQAFVQVRRAALLGEPGAGKTTTLWKLAHDALEAALADAAAPIPLLVSLGKWTETEEGLSAFLERQLGELGAHLASLLASRRAVLLLDGLNEMPVAERAAKAAEIKAFLQQHRALAAMVSCRELDYTGDLSLDLDTVSIRPLDPPRIFEFVTGYLTARARIDRKRLNGARGGGTGARRRSVLAPRRWRRRPRGVADLASRRREPFPFLVGDRGSTRESGHLQSHDRGHGPRLAAGRARSAQPDAACRQSVSALHAHLRLCRFGRRAAESCRALRPLRRGPPAARASGRRGGSGSRAAAAHHGGRASARSPRGPGVEHAVAARHWRSG